MSDVDSSLPVRTQSNGDVVAFLADGTIPSQLLAIDASGRVIVKLNDGNGNPITSQANGAQQALDVGINVAGIQIDPRQIRALASGTDSVTAVQGTSPWVTKDQADGPVTPGTVASFSILIGGQYNSSLPVLTNGQQAAIQVDSSGRLLVTSSSADDHNYGVVGANTLRTAAQIGNATGAADFNYGVVGAQTLRTASEIGNATGAADFNFGAAGAQTIRVASLIGNSTGAANFNYGTIGAQSLRVASQIGNATGAADFNAGATGAQTLRVEANQGAPNSVANSWPIKVTDGTDTMLVNTDGSINVVISDSTPGTSVNDYKRAIAIAAGATDNHDYTVTAGKTLHFNQVESSGSGKARMQLSIETGVATGVFNVFFTQFNSTATPNMSVMLDNEILVAAGVRVRVAMQNRDLVAEDLYSTISGFEV